MAKPLALLVLAAGLAWGRPASAQLFASVLPASRSVQVGTTATAFATIINAGATAATSCSIAPPAGFPGTFSYQTTNPATNQVTGSPNTPVGIAAGATQSFLISLTPTAVLGPTDLALVFACAEPPAATSITGVNTLLFSASAAPVPDVVALAATLANDGIASVRGPTGTGVFSVATVNVGTGGVITVSADTGAASPPVSLALCQTDPASGGCLGPPAASVVAAIGANETPTFGFFLQGAGQIPFDPATTRVFVRFRDQAGTVRGATSVALRTVADFVGVYSGNGTLTQASCSSPGDNGSFPAVFSVNMSGQIGEAVSGSAVTTFAGVTTTAGFSGFINVAGTLVGTFAFTTTSSTGSSSGNGTFAATLAGNALSVQFNGQATAGSTCAFTGVASIARQ